MSTYEVVSCESRCELCGAVSEIFHRAHTCSGGKPDGWADVEHVCYGSDHYYKDGYTCTKLACPDCIKKKEREKEENQRK